MAKLCSLVGALEQRGVHGVEAYGSRQEPEVGLGEAVTAQKPAFGKNFLAMRKAFKHIPASL